MLLHGFTGTAEDWHPCIRPQDDHWLAMDLPGHGEAADAEGPFDDVVRSILSGLPPSIDEIAGYSLGGRVALGMLRLAPERFRHATIISAHPGLRDLDQRAERIRQDARWIDCLETQGIEAFVTAWERQPLFQTQALLPSALLDRQRERRLRQRPSGLISSLGSLGLGVMPDTWHALADYPGQLRWIVGQEDTKFVDIARSVRKLRPDMELHVLAEIGHNVPLEAPDSLTALLID